jgi:hypothetical protein
MIEKVCYNNYMKSLIALITLTVATSSIADCRYTIIKQGQKYLLVKKVLGDLPSKTSELDKDLRRGINDIKYKNIVGSDDETDGETEDKYEEKESRVKVRFETEDEDYANQLLKRYCP